MAHGWRLVQWTPFKRRFDAWMLAGMALFLLAFAAGSLQAAPPGQSFTPAQVLIRASGTLALLMLSLTLCIGPLARLSPRFRPWLYNRRHLGVATCAVALVHAGVVTVWYHGFGVLHPLVSLLSSNAGPGIAFEWPGLLALLVLLLMAATSHDVWNHRLGPGRWKALHMAVYPAWALVLVHVALGAWQTDAHPAYRLALGACAGVVALLHLVASRRASGADLGLLPAGDWLRVGPVDGLPRHRGLVLEPAGAERIAVFHTGTAVVATTNVCPHQGGPLGEGQLVDGCITCPWHGHQFRAVDGCAPPPFDERIATHRTRIHHGIVFVHRQPSPLDAPAAPSLLAPAAPPR